MEDNALYGPLLKQAWKITKKYKNLWFFGLFAALLSTGGEFEILSQSIYRPENQPGILSAISDGLIGGLLNGLKAGGTLWQNLFLSFASSPLSAIFILLVLLVAIAIAIFLIWLAIVSQVGLINNINLITKNKKPTVNDGISVAVNHVWPVFTINIILKLLLFVLFFFLGQEIMLLLPWGLWGTIAYYITFVIFIIVVFTISFVLRYQIFYLVLKKQNFHNAIYSACRLFKNNWLISLETAFFLFLVYVVAAFITSFIIAVFITMPFVVAIQFQWAFWITIIVAMIGLLLMLAIAFIITATLNTFQWSIWTMLFNRLDGDGGVSKIIRSTQQFSDFIVKK